MMCSPPATAAAATASKDHEGNSAGCRLRVAVVGENADELGLRLAEVGGFVATSMDELMKGRKGRKTDNVKARVASEWLSSRARGERGGQIGSRVECWQQFRQRRPPGLRGRF